MIDKETTRLKIVDHQDIRKTLWTVIIVLVGGIATILTNVDSPIKLILVIVGAIGVIIFVNSIIHNNTQITKLFTLLDKEV